MDEEECPRCGYKPPDRLKELKIKVELIYNEKKFLEAINPVFRRLTDDGVIDSWTTEDIVRYDDDKPDFEDKGRLIKNQVVKLTHTCLAGVELKDEHSMKISLTTDPHCIDCHFNIDKKCHSWTTITKTEYIDEVK